MSQEHLDSLSLKEEEMLIKINPNDIIDKVATQSDVLKKKFNQLIIMIE
jgi:hypothetical protein